jgi:hypothetical protein
MVSKIFILEGLAVNSKISGEKNEMISQQFARYRDDAQRVVEWPFRVAEEHGGVQMSRRRRCGKNSNFRPRWARTANDPISGDLSGKRAIPCVEYCALRPHAIGVFHIHAQVADLRSE